MPKTNFELKDFSAGVITNADSSDIPDGAAKYALNVSPTSQLGAAESINQAEVVTRFLPAIANLEVFTSPRDGTFSLAANIGNNFTIINDYNEGSRIELLGSISSSDNILEVDNTNNSGVYGWVASRVYSKTDGTGWYPRNNPSGQGQVRWLQLLTPIGTYYELSYRVLTALNGVNSSISVWTIPSIPPNNGYRHPAGTTAYQAHLYDGDKLAEGVHTTSATNTITFKATTERTVLIMAPGAGDVLDIYDNMILRHDPNVIFSKNLGYNLDFTSTNRGLFIGSPSSKPHVYNKSVDEDGDVKTYLVESECKSPTAQKNVTQIDQMIWVEDSANSYKRLISMIYGYPKIFQMVFNDHATPGTDYFEFNASDEIDIPKGLGGIRKGTTPGTMWAWDFEGWKLYKLTLPTDTHYGSFGAVTITAEYTLYLDEIADGAVIMDVVESSAANPDMLYLLFGKVGGSMTIGETILGVIDVASEGARHMTSLYTITGYHHTTAYSGYNREKNWLGFYTDVNPTGGKDWYWPVSPSGNQKIPPKYENGDKGDTSTAHSYIGFNDDICWVNTDGADATLETSYGGLALLEGPLDKDGTQRFDMLLFTAKPSGATAYLKKSGSWTQRNQWPNNWPDGPDPDGYWTERSDSQELLTNPMIIAVVPQENNGYGVVGGISEIKEFEMESRAAEGQIATLQDEVAGLMETIDALDINAATAAVALTPETEVYLGDYDFEMYASINTAWASMRNIIGGGYWVGLLNACRSHSTRNTTDINVKRTIALFEGDAYETSNNPTTHGVKVSYSYNGQKTDANGDAYDPAQYEKKSSYINAATSIKTYSAYLTPEEVATFNALPLLGDLEAPNSNSADTNLGAGAFQHGHELRDAYTNWLVKARELRDACASAGNNTMMGFNLQQINHFPMDDNAPIQEEFAQFEELQTTNSDPNYRGSILGSVLGAGIPKFAIADIVLTDDSLNKMTINWNPTHASSRVSGDTFNAEITDETTGETIDSQEAWCLYKPTGVTYQIPSSEADVITTWAGDAVEGLVVAQYTGDLLVRNFQFDSGNTINSYLDTGDLKIGLKISEAPAVSEEETPVWQEDDIIMYNYSFIYDGYQDGPLMASPVTTAPIESDPGVDYLNVEVVSATDNPRITGVNVFRKKQAAEKYRLAKTIQLNVDWTPVGESSTAGAPQLTSGITSVFKDYGTAGISYEALTGMPETMQSTMVDYGESESLGGYLFVTMARHSKLPDANKMIFRSLPGKFSMFNWAYDYIGMPEPTHSLVAHNNRLYAFSIRNMYEIDGYNLNLENEFKGMGVLSQQSALSYDGYLYIANKSGMYRYGGGKFTKLTQLVNDKWTEVFSQHPASIVKLAMDKKYNSIICFFDNKGPNSVDDSPSEALVYTVNQNRWDIWETPKGVKTFTVDENNNLLVCGLHNKYSDSEYAIWSMHTSKSVKDMKWTTKGMTMGQDGRNKKFKTIKIVGRDIYLHSISVDGSEPYNIGIAPTDMKLEVTGKDDEVMWQYKLPRKRTVMIGGNETLLDWSREGRNLELDIRTILSEDSTTEEDNNPILKSVSVTYSLKSLK